MSSGSESPFPAEDSLQETRGADSRLVGSWASGTQHAIPGRIGPYTVVRELGRGSWGAVFLARKENGPAVAVKLLLGHGQANPAARARFVREAQLASRVQHPGVVPLLDAGEDARGLYYAMEYVPGATLKETFLARGRLLPQDACELVANLADALEAAHRQGVIHRDVKPANVILEAKTGRPRLTDFGLARDTWRSSNLTRTREVVGTPAFMAPEQFQGGQVDERADVYALGVILYQALTARLPFEATSMLALQQQVLRGGYPRLRELRPDLPEGLNAIVARSLARNPEQRFGHARELSTALSGDLDDLEALQLTPLKVAQERPRSPVRWVQVFALGLALGLPLHLLLREHSTDPVRVAQQPPPTDDPGYLLEQTFTLAERGVPYATLDWQLRRLELDRTTVTAARVELAFRRGRLLHALSLAESLPTSDRTQLANEARVRGGLAATFLGRYRLATEILRPLSVGDARFNRVARSWLCLADDYTFNREDYATAVALLDSVLAENDRDELGLLCRAYFAIASTKLQGLGHLDRYAARVPDSWVVPHLRGRALRLDSTRCSQAVKHLKRSVELTGGDFERAVAYLIQAQVLDGQLSEARAGIKPALERFPNAGGLVALEAAIAELSAEPGLADRALARLVNTVGVRRADLELTWLRYAPLGPALDRVRARNADLRR